MHLLSALTAPFGQRSPFVPITPAKGIRFLRSALCVLCAFCVLSAPIPALADEVDYEAEAEARKLLPVETNEIDNWPKGPEIGAQSAILMDADTGAILYAKDIYRSLYPASTTKLLTALIAVDESAMNETVVMSHDAVFSVPRDGSNIGMDENQALTMEQALYAVLVGSANEVANAVAEHIAGSMDAFAGLMNERAAALGCVNSHFVNPSGLPDDSHYTCAYDLAVIAKAFFSSELLSKMASTPYYYIGPSDMQPDEIPIYSHNRLLAGNSYEYAYLVGSKTGYTDSARQTLVSCAEKDGMRLICVILKEESPYQFEDTIALFEYGFSNFRKVNVSQNETTYSISNTDFYETSIDIFGSSEAILSLNQNDCVILPVTAEFSDLDCTLSYDTDDPRTVALLSYSYHGLPVGTASIDAALDMGSPFAFDDASDMDDPFVFADTPDTNDPFADDGAPGVSDPLPADGSSGETLEAPSAPEDDEPTVIFVNIKRILLIVVTAAIVIAVILYLAAYIRSYHFSSRHKDRKRRRSRRRTYRRTRTDPARKEINIRETPVRLNFRQRGRRTSAERQRKTPPSSAWKRRRYNRHK